MAAGRMSDIRMRGKARASTSIKDTEHTHKAEARALVQCSEIKKPTNSSRKVVNKVSTMRSNRKTTQRQQQQQTARTKPTAEPTTATTTTKPSKSSRQAGRPAGRQPMP